MSRLTEVKSGQAIALLMQRQRQQQVALQFGVNVLYCSLKDRRDRMVVRFT
jgi:hypothetical protein